MCGSEWRPAGSADDREVGGAGWFPRRELGSHPDGPEAKQEWGRAGGGRPGITRRIEVNGMVTGQSQPWTVMCIWRSSTQNWRGTVHGNAAWHLVGGMTVT